ncbi:MAG: L,D-transpeptidase family protein [Acidobacteria bacterium]|nr:L,D-transpeptidase family protein [Acidobacteriota bacterium]
MEKKTWILRLTTRYSLLAIRSILGGLFFLSSACSTSKPPAMNPTRTELSAAEIRLRDAAHTAQVTYPLQNPEIKIFKGTRRIELWAEQKLVKSYKVGLGSSPVADKEREGDFRTPEGKFYVCTRNEQSKFHLFLGVSYPNKEDAQRGLASGLITQEQHDAIVDAQTKQERPPWNTPLGGEVGVHGHGSSCDWTWGCIAVENEEIEELWLACPMKTPITIAK